MKILRAGIYDTDLFSKDELDFGTCFYTEDRVFKYFFQIAGQNATLFYNTEEYIYQAINEFLFYSGFIISIKDIKGRIFFEKASDELCLYEISKIQPSQFYIKQKKLENCKKWIKSYKDIYIPIVIRDGKYISLDGHTRLRAALDLGYSYVYIS